MAGGVPSWGALSDILDFVPNHVGVMGAENDRWMDVLEHGRASRFVDFFDIAWSPPNRALQGKLPVAALGAPYGTVLEAGELQLRYEAEHGTLAIFYHQHRFPIDPKSYHQVLDRKMRPSVRLQVRCCGKFSRRWPTALRDFPVGFLATVPSGGFTLSS